MGDGELSKSRETRRRILNAAVECLAELGYSRTTTSTVAARAGLTRPAMQYHYPARVQLIEAVINYVMRQRSIAYHERIVKIDQDESFFDNSVDLSWSLLQTQIFQAFCELMTAARTDPELAAIFAPALAEYDRSRREMAKASFPLESWNEPWLDLRRDVARFLLEGLVQQGALAYNGDRRRADILAFVKVLTSEPEGAILLTKAKERSQRGRG